jgi:hypothetical protein
MINLYSYPRGRLASRGSALAAAVAFGASVTFPAAAQEGSAQKILKAMSDYLAGQPSLAVRYDSDVEIVTPALEKIQFSASGDVTLKRPDKFRITRTGGYADVELVSDGASFSVQDKDGKRFAQVPASASFDQIVEKLRSEHLIEVPGADLLLSKPYEELTAGVIESKHVGTGIVEGVECEHLAFRNHETDWQIWVEAGDRPLPRKYVITSKTVAAAPQYTLRLRDWKPGVEVAADAFKFTPMPGASGVSITALADLDEVPAGSVPGSAK